MRTCDYCGKEISEGFVFDNGCYCSHQCIAQDKSLPISEVISTIDECCSEEDDLETINYAYWTTWEE